MLKNLITISFRTFKNEKGYTIMNILGLTLGITCSLFLVLYIVDELSYDQYHKNGKNIYRIVTHLVEADDEYTRPATPIPLATELAENYTGIKNVVRFFTAGRELFKHDDKRFYEEAFYYADSNVFKMFTYEFIHGDANTALAEPFSIVLTETQAVKYFGSTNIVGQLITFVDRNEQYKVTGVIQDVPHNSHFHFDALMNVNSLPMFKQQTIWGRLLVYTYVQLEEHHDPTLLQTSLDSIVTKHITPLFDKVSIKVDFQAQRITDIHLYSKIQDEEQAGGDINFIYILGAIASFILIIACINYMNLSTARSANRAKEVGIRKVMGSIRSQIIFQFFSEAFLLTFIAALISLTIVCLLLPVFNDITNKHFSIANVFTNHLMLAIGFIVVFVALIAGSYPAFYLSKFNPASVLKGTLSGRGGNSIVRKTLVVAQFSISIFMLISTVVVYHQLNFLLHKDLGFVKEKTLRIAIDDGRMRTSLPVLKDKVLGQPAVMSFATASTSPGENVRKAIAQVEDNEGKMAERGVDYYMADYDFIPTLGMTITAGRNFNPDILSDTLLAVLVNEAMVRKMNWDHPIGKKFQAGNRQPRQVIGVIKDYNQNSLYNEIEPLVILFDKNNYYTYIKLNTNDLPAEITRVERAWKEVYPDKPFEYQLLDQVLNEQYDKEESRSLIISIFTFITMAIACLGLLALVAFTTEQRAKEIGVRKVIGATVSQIIVLIAKDFVVLVLIAAFIAFPAAYYFMDAWLQDFAYRIDIRDEWLAFFVSAAAALIITMITVSYHAAKAAKNNPVESLRSE